MQDVWLECYKVLILLIGNKSYFKIPENFTFETEAGMHVNLYNWYNFQILLLKKHPDKLKQWQKNLLKEIIPINKETYDQRYYEWFLMYAALEKNYKENNHLIITGNTYVKIGNNSINLRDWLFKQIEYQKDLAMWQYILLNDLKIEWKTKYYERMEKWFSKYNDAKKYYEENGHLVVINNNSLTNWLRNQRAKYEKGKLDSFEKELLDDINMIWDNNKNSEYTNWLKEYNIIKDYYLEYGNILVDKNYYVRYTNKNYYPYVWLDNQRFAFSRNLLEDFQIKLLCDLDMIWNLDVYEKFKNIIEEKYISYEQGNITESDFKKYVDAGIFELSDDEVKKGNAIKFTINSYKKKDKK